MSVDQYVSNTFTQLLRSDLPFPSMLQAVASLAAESVEGAQATSITWLSPTGMPLTEASALSAMELEQQQRQTGAGPCIRALDQGTLAEGRIGRAGGPSQMALVVPMKSSNRADGTISWYTGPGGIFDDPDVQTATWFAGQAARTLEVAQTMAVSSVEQFHEALEARGVIDLARGILMAWHMYKAEDAFDELRAVSQHTNIDVRDLATALTDSMSDPNADPCVYFQLQDRRSLR
jgi:hypothetical protein